MRIETQNEEVLFAADPIVTVGRPDIESLKEKAGHNRRKRIRLCAHRNVTDSLHEMLIVHTKETYVRPHKHLNRTESFHLIEGVVQVVVFDDAGNIMEVVQMGDYSSGHRFYYRMQEPFFHTLRITSDYLVFHETSNGPFVRSDTVFPPWAPEENDWPAVEAFTEHLGRAVEYFIPR